MILCLVAFTGVMLSGTGCKNPEEEAPVTYTQEEILKQLNQNTVCKGVFLSNYPITEFSEVDFAAYRGVETFIARGYCPENPAEFTEYIKQVVQLKKGQITNLFIGVDPAKFDSADAYSQEYAEFEAALWEITDVRIDILYPVHPASYWNSKDEESKNTEKDKYMAMTEALLGMGGVSVFYLGNEVWLLGNDLCFTKDNDPSVVKEVGRTIVKEAFCDEGYLIDSADTMERSLDSMVQNVKFVNTALENQPVDKKKNRKQKVLFLGDSIMGNYSYPTSVPAVFGGLSGCETANCGIGGMPLCPGDKLSANQLLDAVKSGAESEVYEPVLELALSDNREEFYRGKEFLAKGNGKDLTVVVEFGLNDYFDGADPAVFKQELESLIDSIYAYAGKADIILVTPGFYSSEELQNGALPFPYNVPGGTLDDYREIIRETGNARNIPVFELTDSAYIDEETMDYYLESDGIHYNSRGRYVIGLELAGFMETIN